MNKRLIFVGLAGLSCVGGLVSFCYLRRNKDMSMEKQATAFIPNADRDRLGMSIIDPERRSENNLRHKEELRNMVKAMTPEEQSTILEVIPVSLCMNRIQQELNHAREFESMIKKAYEMK